MKEASFDDVERLTMAAELLSTSGWEVIPDDVPELGVRAFACTRASEEVRLVCEVYGPLVASVVECRTWQEFCGELEGRAGQDMEKSDSPEEGLVGFVCYGKAGEGVAEVFRVSVEVLKLGGGEAREALIRILRKTRMLEGGRSPASGAR